MGVVDSVLRGRFWVPRVCPCAVVIRSTLAPFDCTTRNGVPTMDADPSIVCGVPGGPHERMRRLGAIMLAGYALGIPVAFGCILFRHRKGVCCVAGKCVCGGGGHLRQAMISDEVLKASCPCVLCAPL